MTESLEEKNITVNRKAKHDFFILQTYEAGIVLVGTEVKALRQNKANLVDSYAQTMEFGYTMQTYPSMNKAV